MANRSGHLDRLEGEVSEVTTLLKDNVDRVLTRGDKLDDIQQKAEDLESSSMNFNRSSRALRRKMCCQNAKMTCILIIVISAIIAGIVLVVLLFSGERCGPMSLLLPYLSTRMAAKSSDWLTHFHLDTSTTTTKFTRTPGVTVKPWENSSSNNSGSHGNNTFKNT